MRSTVRLAAFAAAVLWCAPATAQVVGSVTPSHPLMTPQALSEAEANFGQCLADLWPQAQQRGISRATYEWVMQSTQPDMSLFKLMDGQPEFERPIWWYVDTLVTDARIRQGREMLALHKATFDAIERQWGVDRYLITAIWGIRVQFRYPRRHGRPRRDALDRVARLHRPPAELFP